MKHITIDCRSFADKAALHKALAENLSFPHWYGHNLDALYDCLTELEEPIHLTLRNFTDPGGFRDTMLDAANAGIGFSVSFE